MLREDKIATHNELTSNGSRVNPWKLNPSKINGLKLNAETILVKAKKAKTFVNQAKSPKVNKFKGSNNTFKSGTKIILMIEKINPPNKSVVNPPLYLSPGISWIVTHKEARFIR